MSGKFSSTSTASLARFIGALFTTLFCVFGTGFMFWGVLCFGSHWLVLPVVALPLFACAIIFCIGTFGNWHDYKRMKMLESHRGDITDILAGHLNSYWFQVGKPMWFNFTDFFMWMDRIGASLDGGQQLDAVIELEKAGELERYYPEEGGMQIHLLPAFRKRKVFAIAPQSKNV